jgi:hypothetical protein
MSKGAAIKAAVPFLKPEFLDAISEGTESYDCH